ncbi:ribosome small subunit-dependent GTPase A [bacterium]|nr:ribosome small subunit-dependent GTPase A [bacterium]
MAEKGQIYKIHSDFYYVSFNGNNYECKLREVLKKQKQKIVVGDYVEFENGAIEKVLPKINYIPRPNVANIDQIIIVSAVKEPELDFKQLNRYICFAKYYNIPAKLCFNKSDLSLDDSTIEKVFQIYEPLGYDIVFTSAKEKDGIEEFKEILEGKISVLCGNSGVGKSSLINAINPELNLRTKSVSEKTERGTHTTRHCEIVNLTGNTKIVDTPGFSNLKFDFLMPAEVGNLFDEIKQYKGSCKFADCLHETEAGCAVLENIGDIDISRYESYLAFTNEAKEYKERIKYAGTKRERETSFKNKHDKIAVKISTKKRESARNTAKQKIHKAVHEDENERIN